VLVDYNTIYDVKHFLSCRGWSKKGGQFSLEDVHTSSPRNPGN